MRVRDRRPSTRMAPSERRAAAWPFGTGSSCPSRWGRARRRSRPARARRRRRGGSACPPIDAAARPGTPARRGPVEPRARSASATGPARGRGEPAATRSGDDVEWQLDRLRIGDVEEAVDTADVAGRPGLQIEDAIRAKVQRFLDAMLDDDDRAALVGQRREAASSRRSAVAGSRFASGSSTTYRPVAGASGCRPSPGAGARRPTGRPSRGRGGARCRSRTTPRGSGRGSPRVGCPGSPGPKASSDFDRRADDLLGRVLQHRPDRRRRCRAA